MRKANGDATVWVHKRGVFLFSFAILFLFVLVFFTPSDEPNEQIISGTITDTCTPIGEQNRCIQLESVESAEERRRGLSGREQLAVDAGMLFDFGVEDTRCMWMPDMNFSIDIVWLNEQAQIVDVMSDIAPETYPKSFCGAEPARYVIELNAGVAESAGVEPGQRLEL